MNGHSGLELLTIDETSEILGTSRSSAYRMAREGRLPLVRVGRQMRVPRSLLVELIEEEARRSLDNRMNTDSVEGAS